MSDFSRHILLYAKGHYGESKNGIIADLKKILAVYANIEPQYLHDNAILQAIIRAFIEYNKEFSSCQNQEWLEEIVGVRWEGMNRKPEEVMIGALSITKGENLNGVQKLNIQLS